MLEKGTDRELGVHSQGCHTPSIEASLEDPVLKSEPSCRNAVPPTGSTNKRRGSQGHTLSPPLSSCRGMTSFLAPSLIILIKSQVQWSKGCLRTPFPRASQPAGGREEIAAGSSLTSARHKSWLPLVWVKAPPPPSLLTEARGDSKMAGSLWAWEIKKVVGEDYVCDTCKGLQDLCWGLQWVLRVC